MGDRTQQPPSGQEGVYVGIGMGEALQLRAWMMSRRKKMVMMKISVKQA